MTARSRTFEVLFIITVLLGVFCVGFGISKREHIKQLSGIADGAIVGSAFVKRITHHAASGTAAIAQAVAEYCKELVG